MAKSSKDRGVLAAFTDPVKLEIRQPRFEQPTSLAALDLRRLSKGSHKIENWVHQMRALSQLGSLMLSTGLF